MPLTLLQKNIAGRIIRLFKRYHISPQAVILEITEEQAFSNAESSMYNMWSRSLSRRNSSRRYCISSGCNICKGI